MSWNPSIKFKLRDDQIVFCDLIFDKNGASLVCDMLKNIKEGKPENIEVLRQVLTEWCFTDSEFENLKVEFDRVKEDIAKFKQISTSFGARWTASIKSVGIAMDYIAGSSTWVQKYKENKAIAAGLYQQIRKSGYKFSVAEEQEYNKRYADVIQSSTDTELVEAYLQKQYREDLAAGDVNAVRKYCDALVETGCLTQEQAKRKEQMLGYFAAASGEFTRQRYDGKVEVKRVEDPPAPMQTEKPVKIIPALLSDWLHEIQNLDSRGYPAEADSALSVLWGIMCLVYQRAEIPTPFNTGIVINDKKTAWDAANALLSILTLPQNIGLVECSDIYLPADDVHNLEKYWISNVAKANTDEGDGYITVTPEIVERLSRRYSDLLLTDKDPDLRREILDMIRAIHNSCYGDNIEELWTLSTPLDDIVYWTTTPACGYKLAMHDVQMPRKKINRLTAA